MATRYTVQVVVSGGGPTYDVCVVDNLKEATGVIKSLDAMHDLWLKEKYPDNWPIYIQHYEGCDVYAAGKVVLFIYTDAWEEVT